MVGVLKALQIPEVADRNVVFRAGRGQGVHCLKCCLPCFNAKLFLKLGQFGPVQRPDGYVHMCGVVISKGQGRAAIATEATLCGGR